MQAGAIAIVQVRGNTTALDELIRALTRKPPGPVGTMRLAGFHDDAGEIDAGLIVRAGERDAHLMPHGGPRVVQRLLSRLRELGAELPDANEQHPRLLYPEADDDYEALMLHALHRARSPLAIDLLLDQPQRWRERVSDADRARSRRLNRLIEPPLVVLAGPANVGKSTLSNALLGRSMSIAVDQPGTTRDYTAGAIELAGLVVLWHDTPGLRDTSDPIEADAIELARQLMDRADFLIAMTDHQQDWPALPRMPDLRVANKSDLGRRDDGDFNISMNDAHDLPTLVRHIRDLLLPPADLQHPGPWLFDDRLQDGG